MERKNITIDSELYEKILQLQYDILTLIEENKKLKDELAIFRGEQVKELP